MSSVLRNVKQRTTNVAGHVVMPAVGRMNVALLPSDEDVERLVSLVLSNTDVDSNIEGHLISLAGHMLRLAEKTFDFGQVLAGATGRLKAFSLYMDEYLEGKREHVPLLAFSHPEEAVSHVLVYHVHNTAPPNVAPFVKSLHVQRALLCHEGEDDTADHAPTSSFAGKIAEDPLAFQYGVVLSDLAVFQAPDHKKLLNLFRKNWLLDSQSEAEAAIQFLPQFSSDILEYGNLCVTYWHALYQLLHGTPANPFGAITEGFRSTFAGYSTAHLLSLSLITLRGIITFRDGTREFYDKVAAAEDDAVYR